MKRLLLLMLLAGSYITMQADQVQTLIVQLKDGSQTPTLPWKYQPRPRIPRLLI